MDDDRYMYGGEDRDPRKRKRQVRLQLYTFMLYAHYVLSVFLDSQYLTLHNYAIKITSKGLSIKLKASLLID